MLTRRTFSRSNSFFGRVIDLAQSDPGLNFLNRFPKIIAPVDDFKRNPALDVYLVHEHVDDSTEVQTHAL